MAAPDEVEAAVAAFFFIKRVTCSSSSRPAPPPSPALIECGDRANEDEVGCEAAGLAFESPPLCEDVLCLVLLVVGVADVVVAVALPPFAAAPPARVAAAAAADLLGFERVAVGVVVAVVVAAALEDEVDGRISSPTTPPSLDCCNMAASASCWRSRSCIFPHELEWLSRAASECAETGSKPSDLNTGRKSME